MRTKDHEFDVAIIGGGAAGLISAIQTARMGRRTALIDANATPGRKLSATGSGRGNLTNSNAKVESYFCDSPESLKPVLSAHPPQKVRDVLEQFGVPTFATQDGWVYPKSESAANVAAILTQRAILNGVVLFSNTLVTNIVVNEDYFELKGMQKEFSIKARKVIVATGGPAAPQLGARDNLIPALNALGHHIKSFYPALAPIETIPKPPAVLRGVRLDAALRLKKAAKIFTETQGNIIFTEWGINGPGVMDISHNFNSKQQFDRYVEINLLPGVTEKIRFLNFDPVNRRMPLISLLQAYLPPRAAGYVCNAAGISPGAPLPLEIGKIDTVLVRGAILTLHVKTVRGYKYCQAAAGGITFTDVNAETLQSKIVPGLFFAGEVLDVSGPCGGYNLHWAFASGLTAAKSAAA